MGGSGGGLSSWVPTIYVTALGVVPWVMMGELFTQSVKIKAVTILATYNWTISFIMLKTFQLLVATIGDLIILRIILFFNRIYPFSGKHGVFFLFAGICVVCFFFILIFVIETKEKNFIDIQKDLKKTEMARPWE